MLLSTTYVNPNFHAKTRRKVPNPSARFCMKPELQIPMIESANC